MLGWLTSEIRDNVKNRRHDDTNASLPERRCCNALNEEGLHIVEHARVVNDTEAARAAASAEDKANPPHDPVDGDLIAEPVEEQEKIEFDEPNSTHTEHRYDSEYLDAVQCIREEVRPHRRSILNSSYLIHVDEEQLTHDSYAQMAPQREEHKPVLDEETMETNIANIGTASKGK